MELRGFIGFPSAGTVIDYLLARDFEHLLAPEFEKLDRVCVVEAHSETNMAHADNGLIEGNLFIPTMTRGYIKAALTENSPHAKHVTEYLDKEAERSADADPFTTPVSFAEWWLSVGGRFFVQNLGNGNSLAVHYMPVGFDIEMENDVDMDASVDHDAEVPPNPEQVVVQAAHQQDVASNKSQGIFSGRYGLYKHHSFSTGVTRIWSEMGIVLPAAAVKEHMSYHPVYTLAPVFSVDLRLLGDVYVTDTELLTWFPDHLVFWPDCLDRLSGARWTVSGMLQVFYKAHGIDTTSGVDKETFIRDRSRVCHQLKRLGRPVPEPYTDLTFASWREPRECEMVRYNSIQQLTDYYVSDLADGVSLEKFPSGGNAGPLTTAIRITRDHPDDAEAQGLKLSGVSAFLKKHGLFAHFGAGQATEPAHAHSGADV